uniref:Putative LOV domain-containing protein n=1 Tax=Synura petersenii TaxID=52555 RepID=A0A126WWA6_9STRA|nr:putative LOV domain-containing protein [Synura petersenii]
MRNAFLVSEELIIISTILSNNDFRLNFVIFLINMKAIDSECCSVTNLSSYDEDLGATLEYLANIYGITSCELDLKKFNPQENMIYSLLTQSHSHSASEVRTYLESSRDNPLLIIMLEILPKFIDSINFRKWWTGEFDKTLTFISTTSPDADITLPEVISPDVYETIVLAEATFPSNAAHAEYLVNQSIDDISIKLVDFKVKEIDNFSLTIGSNSAEYVMKQIDYLEVNRILRCDPWLFAFIRAVEDLPISITLSVARRSRRGFPLIYVNKQFETLTGYPRSTVIGANCRFLQRSTRRTLLSEFDNIDTFTDALANATPIVVRLLNFRRNGQAFRNLVTIKPLFDAYGDYQYVLGMQHDISSTHSEKIVLSKKIHALFDYLPSTV